MRVLGLMSGTSLDGLDLAYVDFDDRNPAVYRIVEAETVPYPPEWRKRLSEAFHISGDDLIRLHADYGNWLGRQVNAFLERHGLPRPDLIASHGHTVFHRPDLGYTWQIGSGAHIAAVTGIDTVADFRIQDVAMGGQGAPLVPVGDKLLFGNYESCLNIGGFANISYDTPEGKRIAYDVVPVNILLNRYARIAGKPYDEGGRLAASGRLIPELMRALEDLPYYSRPVPKSLGREDVEAHYLPLIEKYGLSVPDILRTLTEHTALRIARAAGRRSMLVTGGGAFNDYLMERIRRYARGPVTVPDPQTVMFKEALIFALLGYLQRKGAVNVLGSVTGAPLDHSAGVFYSAPRRA
ncbi:MAG: anhydro-N-acetylmuramic acid kinase [Chlorobi bacterium]|nr:anhydro-N-acetylmuramic acid kinase [Chlorobiota bacterium]